MTKDEKIKEVVELVEEYGKDSFSHGLSIVERINSKDDKGVRDDAYKLWDQCKVIESKLRGLIAEAYREGYMSGYAEAQEYL